MLGSNSGPVERILQKPNTAVKGTSRTHFRCQTADRRALQPA